MDKRIEFIVEWSSTILLIAGVALTSFNNYPLNIYVSLAGNFGWFIVALSWKKWSLICIQSVITLIYISGLITQGIIL